MHTHKDERRWNSHTHGAAQMHESLSRRRGRGIRSQAEAEATRASALSETCLCEREREGGMDRWRDKTCSDREKREDSRERRERTRKRKERGDLLLLKALPVLLLTLLSHLSVCMSSILASALYLVVEGVDRGGFHSGRPHRRRVDSGGFHRRLS